MARSSSGPVVAGLTAAALAVVGFLAFQASAAPDSPAKAGAAHSSPSGHPKDKGKGKGDGGKDKASTAVPASSGTGLRVVYALKAKRVWLVGENEQATRTFEVAPSSVSPEPGTYKVSGHTSKLTGSDGVPVEHIVQFHIGQGGIVFGFSAAIDGSTPDPNAPKKTGAVREQRADGAAMWKFATIGTKVVVVP
ncbi:L,D-transpeptidase [Streptomyces sp. NPDC050617]|uniref:L,D-transpeptidase n=1 Tax=Streptomyces sp. NPDC050617 TaxID=3154628 RepID=UPI00343A1202